MSEFTDANTRRLRILQAEIDTISAMMSLIKYTREAELLHKYQEVARRSYISAMDLVAVSTFTAEEEQEVWDQLTAIRRWLETQRLL